MSRAGILRFAFVVCLPLATVQADPIQTQVTPDDSVFTGLTAFANQPHTSVEIDASLLINFTGGVGPGFYVPCLFVSYGPRTNDAFARLGSVQADRIPVGGPCSDYTNPGNQIPFVFGVPSLAGLRLFAEVFTDGSASASFPGNFVVLDAFHQVIPGASWTVQDVTVPEPVTAASVFCGLALMFAGCRLFGHRKF
jgi:hypothetical protein